MVVCIDIRTIGSFGDTSSCIDLESVPNDHIPCGNQHGPLPADGSQSEEEAIRQQQIARLRWF
jgi:hypothetical protein